MRPDRIFISSSNYTNFNSRKKKKVKKMKPSGMHEQHCMACYFIENFNYFGVEASTFSP